MILKNEKPIDIFNQLAGAETKLEMLEQIQFLSLRENRNLIHALYDYMKEKKE